MSTSNHNQVNSHKKAIWLKLAIFATGISGLVAEFVLSTLASYFIGDTITQWTVVLSIMLFSMGLGSQVSRLVKKRVLLTFLIIEVSLSLLICFSPLVVFAFASKTNFIHLLIYGLALLIGFCIGFEIPLATRLNEANESLKVNISNIMSWDYIGSLVGGLFFAFWGLPHLGLTNTGLVFGAFNLLAAVVMTERYANNHRKSKLKFRALFVFVALGISLGGYFAEPIKLYGEQAKYRDKIVFAKQTKYQQITITQWQDHFWLFINGNQQLSTFDEYLYHEPMVHPAMAIHPHVQQVLIIGGGDGFNVNELTKYPQIENITVVDLDPEMTQIAKTFSGLVAYNDSALYDPRVNIINKDGYNYLVHCNTFYDLVIVDLPDAKDVSLNKLYSKSFYRLVHNVLRPNGIMITQAGSPYYATKAFYCIQKTMQSVGFETLPMHNQVLTLGEWGWIIGGKSVSAHQMKKRMESATYADLTLKWLNQDASKLLTAFGKPLVDTTGIEINTIDNPVLYRYYLNGNWDLY